jgi:cytosine/adenosine deaminase-related metal-dependent hydrolase
MPGSVPSRVSRRNLFQIAAGVTAGRARGLAQPSPSGAATLERLERAQGDPNRRILLRGGVVLSLDPKVGDFEKADVLVEGKKISALGPNLDGSRSALIVDASDHIVMPGFVDTHHHQYETLLRSILSDGNLGLTADSPTNYLSTIQGILTPAYRPEDSYISELVASLNQINAGVTTTVDTSQVSHTPAHTDACIAGLNESGRRAVFAYSSGQGSASQFPQDLTRLTLALHTGLNADHWKLARSLGAAIVMHFINGDLQAMKNAGLLSNWSREEKYCPLRAPTPNTSTARRSTKPLGD